MQKLILIKHAPPEVVPGVSSEQWSLSEKGRALCEPLAKAIAVHRPARIVSSEEPKAAETAEQLAKNLNISWQKAAGLHEHDRRNVPHMRSGEFISLMELFFRKPDELVLGQETANQATARFEGAIRDVLQNAKGENVAVVSHGTVIALLLDRGRNESPFRTWRTMGLPSFAVLTASDLALESRVDRIE